jgi:ATP/maltotriose-dependent transcriptional regulator MalT
VDVAGPLLATKLHLPRRRRGLVTRPRLSERLRHGDDAVLTLVSAPAEFGRTTALTEWLTAIPTEQRSVAWLSLDERDNDPALFRRSSSPRCGPSYPVPAQECSPG